MDMRTGPPVKKAEAAPKEGSQKLMETDTHQEEQKEPKKLSEVVARALPKGLVKHEVPPDG